MRNTAIHSQSWSSLLHQSYQVAVSALVASVATIAASTFATSAAPQPSASVPATLPNGVYLYGQSPEPEQVGQGYFVFEVNQGSVVGALYMPRSSFDCASGSFQADQLALNVVNSYDRSKNPFEIAVERTTNVASTGNPAQQAVNLQGFHRLASLSDNDQRMLDVCKADLQTQAKHLN